jgi:hypothetical protein
MLAFRTAAERGVNVASTNNVDHRKVMLAL